jgi:adhesin transport system membrane fusion protein
MNQKRKKALRIKAMKKNKSIDFMQDSSPSSVLGARFFSHMIMWAIALFLIVFILWANFAELDEVTVGQGKVIPSSQIQVIQNLEGGIVKELYVKQGDIVERGQALIQLDETLFRSKYNELLKKKQDVEIELVRLKAELNNQPLTYGPTLKESNPNLIAAETALFNARKTQLDQLKHEISLAVKELNMTAPLVKKGAASPVELLRLERTVSELKSKLHEFTSKTVERYSQAEGEYMTLNEEMLAAKDRFTRTMIRSPVKGIIKQIKVNTIGGVIKPGMDILEIVPLDDTLLIEAKIRPQDIGFIHPGQKAMVKISAYDFSIYGGLQGEIEKISADTIIDENDKQQRSYYVILVRTQKNHLGTKEKPLQIIPGMQSTVDILTGRKTVMDYLLKPILKAKQNALRER